MNDTEIALKSLLKGKFSSLMLDFNDHSSDYRTAEEAFPKFDNREWVNYEEWQKAIDTNSVWNLRWYPDTPIGSYSIRASSIQALIDYISQENY